MLDLDRETAAKLDERLRQEEVVWFTSVTPSGRPVPNPVWFVWDGEYITVFSQPTSYRVRNLKQNPQVALTFQGVDAMGNNVLIISGEASLKTDNQSVPQAYWDKYAKFLPDIDLTQEQMKRDYSVEIRIKPVRVRVE